MSGNIAWSDFWPMLAALPDDRKALWTKALNYPDSFYDWMKTRGEAVVAEVLSEAPIQIVITYIHMTDVQTAKRLRVRFPKALHSTINDAFNHPEKVRPGG